MRLERPNNRARPPENIKCIPRGDLLLDRFFNMPNSSTITLHNGSSTISFCPIGDKYRPEWFRDGDFPVLRFKDHEWLNIGPLRITEGSLYEQSDNHLCFGGTVTYADTVVTWSVDVSLPTDSLAGFTIRTSLIPAEPIELLDALSCFETPYDYSGKEERMIVIAQQPVYRSKGDEEISGAGFTQPIWYYGRPGKAHLTYQSSTPMMAARLAEENGSNLRHIMILGNWQVCSVKDLIAQPSRYLRDETADIPFPDPQLSLAKGKRGFKFLIGAVNWTSSLFKDPNVLADANCGLQQELTIIANNKMPAEHWDGWLADGWERLCRTHFPNDGIVPAYQMVEDREISWRSAAEWLSYNLAKPAGYVGLYEPGKGLIGYSASTRPRTGDSPKYWRIFCGQWAGPIAYLANVWGDEHLFRAADNLETDALFQATPLLHAESVKTISYTPHYLGLIRKGKIIGLSDYSKEIITQYLPRHSEVLLNPPVGTPQGDAGLFAWDALANLEAADIFPADGYEKNARELLFRINDKLNADFWTFNCAIENDLVGAGQSRPFGHGIAASANFLAWRRFGDEKYLQAAKRFANLTLAMHFIVHNESPVFDLDTRGWAQGSTGGRDQIAQLPPWETGFALQQFAPLLTDGYGRDGMYDVLWLHSHTGLAQFPIARVLKRIYNPNMSITYRPMSELATERAFYQNLPYLSYENPWDQTMLAAYQGAEPLIFSLYFGNALVHAENSRVLSLIPEAAEYSSNLPSTFTVHCWNPTPHPLSTRLRAVIAEKRAENYRMEGNNNNLLTAEQPWSELITIPSRKVLKIRFTRE